MTTLPIRETAPPAIRLSPELEKTIEEARLIMSEHLLLGDPDNHGKVLYNILSLRKAYEEQGATDGVVTWAFFFLSQRRPELRLVFSKEDIQLFARIAAVRPALRTNMPTLSWPGAKPLSAYAK